MIDLSLHELIGGEPVTDIDQTPRTAGPVWHVHLAGDARNIYEKVIADTHTEAVEKARDLIGDIEGLAVTGPYEHIAPKAADALQRDDAPRKA